MLNRKSQGMPINTIIIAVIALAVLVVLIFVFTGKIKIFSSTIESCEAQGGGCDPDGQCDQNQVKQSNAKCTQSGAVCCIQILAPSSQPSQV